MCGFSADCPRKIYLLFMLALLAGCAGTGTDRGTDVVRAIQVPAEQRQEVVMVAMGLMGSPYRNGGTDPSSGFDCSGLVSYVFQTAASTQLPRTASSQASVARRISRRALRAGDLVFFNTLGRPNSHVGIYIGGGQFVNAPSSGGRVRVDTLDNPYFSRRFESARTLFAAR